MKKFIALICVCMVSGCAQLQGAVSKGQEVNDNAITAAEFTICEGASVGSVRRKFNTPELAKIWQDFCKRDSDFAM